MKHVAVVLLLLAVCGYAVFEMARGVRSIDTNPFPYGVGRRQMSVAQGMRAL